MTIFLSAIFCLILIGTDQVFKYLVVEYLKPIEYIDVIKGLLRFRYVENSGAVFGSFATHTVFLTIFSVILLAFTVYFLIANKNKSKLVNFCLLLMISGGIGNIIDRIRLQYVVDYIEPVFVNFAVFNFADCLITVGAFILIIYLIVDLVRDTKKQKSPESEADSNEQSRDDKKFSKKLHKTKKTDVDEESVASGAETDGEPRETASEELKTEDSSKSEEKEVSATGDKTSAAREQTTQLAESDVSADTPNAKLPLSDDVSQINADKQKSKRISIESIDDIDFSVFE